MVQRAITVVRESDGACSASATQQSSNNKDGWVFVSAAESATVSRIGGSIAVWALELLDEVYGRVWKWVEGTHKGMSEWDQ